MSPPMMTPLLLRLPAAGYYIFKEAEEQKHYVRNKYNTDFDG